MHGLKKNQTVINSTEICLWLHIFFFVSYFFCFLFLLNEMWVFVFLSFAFRNHFDIIVALRFLNSEAHTRVIASFLTLFALLSSFHKTHANQFHGRRMMIFWPQFFSLQSPAPRKMKSRIWNGEEQNDEAFTHFSNVVWNLKFFVENYMRASAKPQKIDKFTALKWSQSTDKHTQTHSHSHTTRSDPFNE